MVHRRPLNVSDNCLDRHVLAGGGIVSPITGRASRATRKTITYQQLLDDVCQIANALKELGVQRGDRIAIYMPMIPELPVAMLACTRIGAAHTVVFGGFSAMRSPTASTMPRRVAVIADGGYRRATGAQDELGPGAEFETTIEHSSLSSAPATTST